MWGVQGGASSTLVKAPQAPDRPRLTKAQGSPTRQMAASWNQDDFAHNLIVLQGIVCGLRLRQRESLVQHRLELAGFEAGKGARGEVGDQPGLLRGAAVAKGRAHDSQPLGEDRAEVENGFRTAHRGD